MKFRELLNEKEEVVEPKKLLPIKQKFKEDVLGIKTEAKLPPGFSSDDIETTGEFVKSEKNLKEEEDELEEDASDAQISDVDVDKLKKDVYDKKKSGKDPEKGHEPATKQGKMLHASNIVDEHGNLIDTAKLISVMSNRPKKLIGQNSKIAKSGSDKVFYDITLPAYQGLFVDEKKNEIKVVKTCPMAGECKKFCYASKGGYIQYPDSSINASRLVTFFMNDWDGFKAQLISELKSASVSAKKSGKTVVLRWHDSGDFISENYLMMAMDVAKETKDINVRHYAYTKMVPLVKSLEAKKPDNFLFRFSFGGEKDELIDVKKDYHAKVVPSSVFAKIPHTIELDKKKQKMMVFKPEDIPVLKDAVAKHFDIEVDTIKTYDEIIKMKEEKEPKWNVLIWKGNGDEEAQRDDVLGVYLFIH